MLYLLFLVAVFFAPLNTCGSIRGSLDRALYYSTRDRVTLGAFVSIENQPSVFKIAHNDIYEVYRCAYFIQRFALCRECTEVGTMKVHLLFFFGFGRRTKRGALHVSENTSSFIQALYILANR